MAPDGWLRSQHDSAVPTSPGETEGPLLPLVAPTTTAHGFSVMIRWLAAVLALCLVAERVGRSGWVVTSLASLRAVPNTFRPVLPVVPRFAPSVGENGSPAEGDGQRIITSRHNLLAKQVRRLHDSKGRREQGLLLLEGTHMLQECLRLGLEVDSVVVSPEWQAQHPSLLTQLRSDVPVSVVSSDVLASIATTVTPDGVVVLIPPPYKVRPNAQRFVLALDFVQDPGNLGTLIRTAAAAEVEQIWLGGGADPYQPKVLRAAAGAALSLPMERLDDLAPRLQGAREAGMQVIAAVVTAPTPYWVVDWTRPTVLLLGSEGRGVAPELLQYADVQVRVPLSTNVESLNVAVAAGLLLFERGRQQIHSPRGL
eukprot:GGOE01061548.1.p1 GENE.GGOE01061548.1~~GGOE01061548.1.p1  ORF type:complete len:378 (-),score=90.10 GGOE01061548.1:112-1215(-)